MSTGIPEEFVEEIRGRVGEWIGPRTQASIRVTLAGTGPALATCDVWCTPPDGKWNQVSDLPAGVGTTMLDLERAIGLAGYAYPRTPDERPAWRVDHNGTTTYTLDVNRP